MTPSFIGRMTEMVSGVRPSMSRAPSPTASTVLSRLARATTAGSLMTMPRPFTYTSTFTVPRSTPMRFGSTSVPSAGGLDALDGGAEGAQLLVQRLVAAVQVIDVADLRRPFRRQRGDDHGPAPP